MPDYLFVIVTDRGAYVHGEVDTMSEDEMEAAVERVYDFVVKGAIEHVRRMPANIGRGEAAEHQLSRQRWEAHRFNPSHVVSVFATTV